MGIYHWGGEDCVVKNATVYSDGYETICVRWMDIHMLIALQVLRLLCPMSYAHL